MAQRPKARTYDRTIELLHAGATTDSYGDAADGFSSLGTVAARQRVARGAERLASSEVAASAPMVWYIRWAPQFAVLNAKDRVVANGRTYEVISAIEIGRREEIEIAAVGRGD